MGTELCKMFEIERPYGGDLHLTRRHLLINPAYVKGRTGWSVKLQTPGMAVQADQPHFVFGFSVINW